MYLGGMRGGSVVGEGGLVYKRFFRALYEIEGLLMVRGG